MKRLASFFALILIVLSVDASAYGPVLLDRIVAIVNKDVITWSELRNAMNVQLADQLKDLTPDEREKRLEAMEKPFLDEYINFKLQIQDAERLGIEVRPEEVTDAIESIKKKYSLDSDTFIKSLKAEGLTLDEYKKSLSEQILVSRLVTQEIRSKIVVSDREVSDYYEASKEKYQDVSGVRLRQIFFKAPQSPEQRASIEAKAKDIYERLKAGEDFATLAEKYSEDKSARFGGDLGMLKAGSLMKEIEDVASKLKVGEISKPFWSKAGLHIIKLEQRVEGGPLASVKEEIKKMLLEKKFKEKYDQWMNDLRKKAYIEVKLK